MKIFVAFFYGFYSSTQMIVKCENKEKAEELIREKISKHDNREDMFDGEEIVIEEILTKENEVQVLDN